MELATEEIRMAGNLDDLNVGSVRRRSRNSQAGAGQQSFVFAIEFVTVTMTLADFGFSISAGSDGIGFELALPCSQAHGAAEFVDALQLAQLVNNAMRRAWIELAGIGFMQLANIASKLDA